MIEKKCKICGEWFSNRKIAVHYWNIHKLKYKEVCEGEESREVPDTIKDEKSIKKVEKPIIETKIDTPIIETKVEAPIIEKTVQPKVSNKINENGNGEVYHEFYKTYSKVYEIQDEGEVINEWC